MKAKAFLGLILIFILGLSGCVNQYHIPTYDETDSFGDIFEGRRVPQDVR